MFIMINADYTMGGAFLQVIKVTGCGVVCVIVVVIQGAY